jgi:uncharacterized FAD-dependent dehydrogenase
VSAATDVELFIPLDELDDLEALDQHLLRLAERTLGRAPGSLTAVRVLRRSLDARKGRALGYRWRCLVAADAAPLAVVETAERRPLTWPIGKPRPRVVIIGSGPAGTWAALRLSEAGITATLVERGKPVQPRRSDLAQLTRGQLDPDSNYCFGEGGAGTFSDGKLYTRTKDRVGVAAVLNDLVRFGAPADIEIDSRPHVGSNRLPKVLTHLREALEGQGVTYRFEAEVTDISIDKGRVAGVRLRSGEELPADVVILAVGHSARSIYRWAHDAGVAIERKPIAVGVRIEHPQSVIDEIQYGSAAGHRNLPPALYELASSGAGRGVYSFCMCPGGWIVPAATENDGVVVNGMSLSKRDSRFANSGVVVSVDVRDFGPDADGPLAGVEFQRRIERAAFRVGGGGFRAPAQRLAAFLAGRPDEALAASSYRPGLTAATFDDVFPPFIVAALREGLRNIGARMSRFLLPDATLIGVETRTSAPVRILRDPASLMSPSCEGLYPAGEGAGFAGGIVSAALDGVRIAEQIVARGY